MIRIDNQNQIDRLVKIRTFDAPQHWNKHVEMFALRTFAQVAQHVRFHINGEHLSLRHALGDSRTEISSAGAKIGNIGRPLKIQCVQNFIRLLPCVAAGVVEFFCPNLRTLEMMLIGLIFVMVIVLCGLLCERFGHACASK